MKNGAFVAWLLGWFLVTDISEYLYFLEYGKPHKITDFYAWFVILMWIFIASLLYEKRRK